MKPKRIIEWDRGMLIDLEMVGYVSELKMIGHTSKYGFSINIGGVEREFYNPNNNDWDYNSGQLYRNEFVDKWKAFKEWQYKTIDERVTDALLNGTNNGTN